MSSSIKVLMISVINLLLTFSLVSCKKNEEKFKIYYLKNDPYYSFVVESPSKIFYSTPNSFEVKSNTSRKENDLLFKEEFKKFQPYVLGPNEMEFENIYVSNVLGETSFTNNHLFEYDVEINKSNNVKANIYYPYDLAGSYQFNVDGETMELLRKSLYQISVLKKSVAESDSKLQNVIVFRRKNKLQICGGKEYMYNSPAYSLFFAVVNGLLLEKIDPKDLSNKHFKIYSQAFVTRKGIPPLPPK